MKDKIRATDLFGNIPDVLSPLFSDVDSPFEAIGDLRHFIKKLVNNPPEGFKKITDGVIVGEGVIIEDGATIVPPAVICDGAEIRQGAYIRGYAFISEGAVVGHCTEVKDSIFMPYAKAPHFNYVGNSILGYGAHLGAGVILSNLKADKSDIVIHGTEDFPTGMRKLGAMVGDGAEIGCNAVLNPGAVIGRGAVVYPLVSFRGVLPEGHIAKSADKIVKATR